MKQVVFMAVFLSLFLSGLAADAKWIPENATPEDVQRLIKMEKEDKAKIIRDQYLREKAEQEQKQATGVAPAGVAGGMGAAGSGREVSSQAASVKSGEMQQETAQGVPGATAVRGEKPLSTVQGAEEAAGVKKAESPGGGAAAGGEKPLVLKKSGWQDWIVIGLFLLISIGCLVIYFYSMNRIKCKIPGERGAAVKGTASAGNTASKGLTLVEILIATAIIAISVLCILSVFRHASLVQPQTGYATKALTLCQEKLEEIRNRPYGSLTTMVMSPPEVENITMGPYGWNGDVPINGGARRTVTITGINEVWSESGPPRFEEVPGTGTYLKAKVKMEWGRVSVGSGSIPYKRQLSVFIAPRP